jgi:hypothetical protein
MRRGRRAAGGGVVQPCIEMDSQSAPAHRTLPAVEDGPHLGVDGIRAIRETPVGGSAGRQPAAPCDADMGRHHVHVMCMFGARQMRATAGCSGGACTRYWLRAPQRTASCSVERGRLRVRMQGTKSRGFALSKPDLLTIHTGTLQYTEPICDYASDCNV